jgi:hypothetical protein
MTRRNLIDPMVSRVRHRRSDGNTEAASGGTCNKTFSPWRPSVTPAVCRSTSMGPLRYRALAQKS